MQNLQQLALTRRQMRIAVVAEVLVGIAIPRVVLRTRMHGVHIVAVGENEVQVPVLVQVLIAKLFGQVLERVKFLVHIQTL